MKKIATLVESITNFAFNLIKRLGLSTSASKRPHKKAVKKIEAEGAKEKRVLLKFD